jgi:diguanylate cyclase (GGDEF)-like protein
MKLSSQRLSMSSRGLRPKFYVAVSLMSIIPILICLNFIFPNSWLTSMNLRLNLVLVVVASAVVLAIAGYRTIREMIEPVIRISYEARQIADGDLEREIKLKREDEIGELGASLNKLTRRIRENMDELKNYGEKTKEINTEINKRVMVLSSMLQISNFITQSAALNEILEVGVSKSMQIAESSLGFLMLRDEHSENFILKTAHGPHSSELTSRGLSSIAIRPEEGLLGKMISTNKTFILDASEALPRGAEELQNLLGLVNMMIVPIYGKDNVVGILGIGNNRKGFKYPHGDEELLAVFAKQIAIAIESESLTRDVARLQIRDGLTGLFNASFIRNRLDEEIKRAIRFQRPCAFILLEVNNLKEYLDAAGTIASETALKRIAIMLLDSISDIDKAARFKDDQFALILPEKNKRQCLERAEEIRKKIEFLFSEEREGVNRLSVTGAVTENPIDGVTANELTGKAEELLRKAKAQAVKNTIIS